MKETHLRKGSTKEFKTEAVALAGKLGSVPEAAKSLGLKSKTLYYWRKQLELEGPSAFRGNGVLKPEDAEKRRLLRENEQLKRENDFLKKATAYFAAQSKQRQGL